jgi:hypothetical protein
MPSPEPEAVYARASSGRLEGSWGPRLGVRRHVLTAALPLILASVGASCAGGGTRATPAPVVSTVGVADTAWVSDALYFGLSKPAGGVVTDAEWEAFLRDVVTPRFPDGLTVWTARGQWRGADGAVAREESRVVQLLHRPSAAADSSIVAIVAEYRSRFAQEAVMRVRSRAEVTF